MGSKVGPKDGQEILFGTHLIEIIDSSQSRSRSNSNSHSHRHNSGGRTEGEGTEKEGEIGM